MQYDFKPELYMDILLPCTLRAGSNNGTLPTAEKSDMQLWICWTLASTSPKRWIDFLRIPFLLWTFQISVGYPFMMGALRISDGKT